jgi:multisubunit Na+/H+ antiporter MnhG subunit
MIDAIVIILLTILPYLLMALFVSTGALGLILVIDHYSKLSRNKDT